MAAPRSGLRAVVEWVVAAGMLAGLLAAASVGLREIRSVSAVTSLSADVSGTQVPTASVPDRAVSVPILLLADGVEVRVGDVATRALARLSTVKELAPPSVERGPNGERQTRVLQVQGNRFVLVIEPFEHDSEPRIAAIYLP